MQTLLTPAHVQMQTAHELQTELHDAHEEVLSCSNANPDHPCDSRPLSSWERSEQPEIVHRRCWMPDLKNC